MAVVSRGRALRILNYYCFCFPGAVQDQDLVLDRDPVPNLARRTRHLPAALDPALARKPLKPNHPKDHLQDRVQDQEARSLVGLF